MKCVIPFLRQFPLAIAICIAVSGGTLLATEGAEKQGNRFGEVCFSKVGGTSGVTYEKVRLFSRESDESPRKVVRNGLLRRHKDAIANVVITHGYMCDKDDVHFLAHHIFPQNKFNVLTHDLRAHGDDPGEHSCTFGLHEAHEVTAAARFLKEHPATKGKPVLSYAFSMGSVASIEAQSRDKTLFDALVLDCPFDSSETVIQTGLDKLRFALFGYDFDMPGKSLLKRYAFQPCVQSLVRAALKAVVYLEAKDIPLNIQPFEPAESAKKITVPCFFIHCRKDDKIPLEAGRAVFNAVAGHKKMWITNGRFHFDSFFYNPEEYTSRVRTFFDQVLSGQLDRLESGTIVEDVDDYTALAQGGSNG